MNRKPIFLDRDGVINKFPGCGEYVKSVSEFEFIPGVIGSLKKIYNAGYDIYIVSNQSGVGKGLYSEEDLEEITQKMLQELEKEGIKIAKIYYCIHRPDEGCNCRKPSPYNVNITLENYPSVKRGDVFVVGDDERDIIMGSNAGIKTVLVKTGAAKLCKDMQLSIQPDFIVEDLNEFVTSVLGL